MDPQSLMFLVNKASAYHAGTYVDSEGQRCGNLREMQHEILDYTDGFRHACERLYNALHTLRQIAKVSFIQGR